MYTQYFDLTHSPSPLIPPLNIKIYTCLRTCDEIVCIYPFVLCAGDELRRGRSSRRDDPRRHTLSGDQHHNYQPALTRSMDLEVSRPANVNDFRFSI